MVTSATSATHVAVVLASVCLAVHGAGWNHGWGTTAAMTFADFNSQHILTDTELQFANDKYSIISFEKCTAAQDGAKTEEAIYSEAARLKKLDPTKKIFFYWATDQQGISCYAAGATYMNHPEWWLKDDNGNVARQQDGKGAPFMDTSNAAAQAWWISVPLGGDTGKGTYKGQPVSELIDGVLADSAGYEVYNRANFSLARLEALEDGKFAMIGHLQAKFAAANGGVVMANGLSMYGKPNEDPRYPGQHNFRVLNFSNGIMNEHTAVFECVNAKNASFNVETVKIDLDTLVKAAKDNGGTKSIFVQTWPGLYSATQFTPRGTTPARVYPPVSAGGEPTPQNNAEWRNALREHFTFAHALFLSIAEANMYWMYAGYWYTGNTGYIACPEDLNACPAPPEWYPNLKKPLGAPLGDRVEVSPYVWTREFEHATVRLDLNKPNASSVTFASDFIGQE